MTSQIGTTTKAFTALPGNFGSGVDREAFDATAPLTAEAAGLAAAERVNRMKGHYQAEAVSVTESPRFTNDHRTAVFSVEVRSLLVESKFLGLGAPTDTHWGYVPDEAPDGLPLEAGVKRQVETEGAGVPSFSRYRVGVAMQTILVYATEA